LPATFSSAFTDYQPVMSPDGKRLYFQSTRPKPGTTEEVLQDIWYVARVGSDWGAPRYMDRLNTAAREGYVAPLRDGSLYFNSDRPGGRGSQDFYFARRNGDSFDQPIPVTALNTPDSENDLFVDPDGRYVIFNRYVDSTRSVDLFLSHRVGNGWSAPKAIALVNGPDRELTPSVSPDGRYFFYTVRNRIMQVDLARILAVR
jgi:Tol biopolymer transport system component